MSSATRAAVALAFAFAAAAAPVSARTAGELLADCEKVDGPGFYVESGRCIGYIDGVTDAAAHNFGDLSPSWAAVIGPDVILPRYCLPAQNVTLRQLRLVFIRYARNNPQNLHRSAISQLSLALAEAFPCSEPRR